MITNVITFVLSAAISAAMPITAPIETQQYFHEANSPVFAGYQYDFHGEPEPVPDPKQAAGFTEGESYNMRIYHYCDCSDCTPGKGITASGKRISDGIVAMHGLPFGTVVEIRGRRYVVEDRGVGAGIVDIFVPAGHGAALRLGTYMADVKIVEIGGVN